MVFEQNKLFKVRVQFTAEVLAERSHGPVPVKEGETIKYLFYDSAQEHHVMQIMGFGCVGVDQQYLSSLYFEEIVEEC